jgi:TonB family protein
MEVSVLQLEQQKPDLPFILAIGAHAFIIVAAIWNANVAMPTSAAHLEHANTAEPTIDIIMFTDKVAGVAKPAAAAVVERAVARVPEFYVPELADGESVKMSQASAINYQAAEWAMPALPVRDTAGDALDVNKLANGPRFTAFSRAPSLKNEDEIVRFLTRKFPGGLRRAGGEARSIVWLLIDMQGRVFKAVLRETSGREEADSVAVAASYLMTFRPAEQAGRAVPVWVQQPVRFKVEDEE